MRWLQKLVVLWMFCISFGCGRTTSNNQAQTQDPQLARETLITALEAWKSGKLDTLKKQEKPIRFLDDDQRAGWKLVSFEPPDPRLVILPHQDVQVAIVLEKNRDKPYEKTVTYQIGVHPERTVLRSDN